MIVKSGLDFFYFEILLAPSELPTSHSVYVATETESNGAKIVGLLPPNFL